MAPGRLAHRDRDLVTRDGAVGAVQEPHDLQPNGVAERLEHVDELDVVALRILEPPHAVHHAASGTGGECSSPYTSTLRVAFERNSHVTMPAVTRATAAATQSVASNASTNAPRAACATTSPRAPPTECACCSAAAREWLACSGKPRTVSILDRKREATRLPSTATPSAPPSSRLVSLTAEPTPALCSGNERMIAPVDGAVVMPMPSACTTTPIANGRYPAPVLLVAAMIPSPSAAI